VVRKDRDEQSTNNPDKINVSEEGMMQVVTHTRISVSQISFLMEKCGLSTLLVRVSCRLKYGDKETKLISVQRSVSQTFFDRALLLASKNNHGSLHPCSRKYIMCG